MSAHVDPDNLPTGEMVDGWRVVRRLGGGGYGTTYQVEKAGSFFALKVAHHRARSGDEQQTDERTQREIACLLSLRHRHIVRVWAHGRWPHPKEGWLYFIMDYVEGANLAQWQEQARPTAHEVAVLTEKVLDALATMHAQGILHRDLKPDNIMMDKEGQPVVVDYGAAHSPAAPRLTKHGLPPGTARYTSPEAVRFEREHRRDKAARYQYTVADELYALGVTLFDVLTDPLPWTDPQPMPLSLPLRQFAHEVNPRVPVVLSLFVAQLLAHEPGQRPEGAERARRDAREFVPLETEEWKKRSLHPPAPVEAPKLPAGAQAQAPAVQRQPPRANSLRRRQWLTTGAVLGLTLLVAGGAALALRGVDTSGPQLPLAPSPSAPVAARVSPPPAPASTPPSSPTPPQEKGPTVKARPAPSSPAPDVCSRKESPPHGTAAWRAWCQCASIVGTLAALQAGCSGPQVRPASEPCPPEATAAAEELGHFSGAVICVDPTQPCDADHKPWLKEGPTTARVIHGTGKVPEGSLVFGEMRINDATGGRMIIRYTLLQLPNGDKYPVCLEANTKNRVSAKAGSAQLYSNHVPAFNAAVRTVPLRAWEDPW